jgi:hypothetical protein
MDGMAGAKTFGNFLFAESKSIGDKKKSAIFVLSDDRKERLQRCGCEDGVEWHIVLLETWNFWHGHKR